VLLKLLKSLGKIIAKKEYNMLSKKYTPPKNPLQDDSHVDDLVITFSSFNKGKLSAPRTRVFIADKKTGDYRQVGSITNIIFSACSKDTLTNLIITFPSKKLISKLSPAVRKSIKNNIKDLSKLGVEILYLD
jgi:hypothetical protein